MSSRTKDIIQLVPTYSAKFTWMEIFELCNSFSYLSNFFFVALIIFTPVIILMIIVLVIIYPDPNKVKLTVCMIALVVLFIVAIMYSTYMFGKLSKKRSKRREPL